VTNPNNLIEENAGWTRGGKSAR